MARERIGKVRGEDGKSVTVSILTDSLDEYILRFQDKDHEFDSPNLRGATFKAAQIEVFGDSEAMIPFSDLELDPEKDYMFYVSAAIDYPLLRSITAFRVDDTVRISIYTDTLPYTKPQLGSPFLNDIAMFGAPDTVIGDFNFGEPVGAESFPVNLLCFKLDEVIVAEGSGANAP